MRIGAIILASSALLATTGAADAAITIYTTQASFTAAITAAGVDTFNNLTPLAPLPASINRTAGAYSYTASDPDALYGAGSSGDAWLTNAYTPNTITLGNFSAGVRGAGANFFGSGEDGKFTASPLGLTITATDASGTVTKSLVNATTTSFVGFVSTGALQSVTVRVTAPGNPYWATINNLTLGTAVAAVPEPGTWALMMVGFGAVGAAVRRRSAEGLAAS